MNSVNEGTCAETRESSGRRSFRPGLDITELLSVPETATPPAAPIAEPAGYLLYSLQAEPEGEVPHEEFWRTTL
jgi:hypothetical protein